LQFYIDILNTKSVEAFLRIWEQIHFGFWIWLVPFASSQWFCWKGDDEKKGVEEQLTMFYRTPLNLRTNLVLFCSDSLTVYASSSQCFCWKGDDQKGEGGARRNGLSSSTIFVLTIYFFFPPFCQRKVITLHCLESLHQTVPNCFVKKI
jgi:hypothetical protein